MASFISEISLSIPCINSRMKLIRSSFLYFCKCSSVIRKLKLYFSSWGFLLNILSLSALRAKNLCKTCTKSSSISFVLIAKDILQELIDPSIKQHSFSFLDMSIGFSNSFGLSANSISGWDYLSTSWDGEYLKFRLASRASLINCK